MAESEPTREDLLKRIAELEKQLNHKKHPTLSFQVGKKGGVSVYGLGRFPVTLYYEQWMQLLARSDDLRTFLVENKSKLKMRPGSGE
jgi:ABC-type Fe3+-hydroxamate transport system substrate-binding protein